jgi:hypothetical protein
MTYVQTGTWQLGPLGQVRCLAQNGNKLGGASFTAGWMRHGFWSNLISNTAPH